MRITEAARHITFLALASAAHISTAQAATFSRLLSLDNSAWTIRGPLAPYQGGMIGTAASSSNAVLLSRTPAGQWSSQVIHSFTGQSGEGQYPNSGVVSAQGAIWGATSGGGNTGCANGCGTIFKLTPPATPGGSWSETLIFSFNQDSDGYFPLSPPIVTADSRVFGSAAQALNDTTRPGGSSPEGGVIYQINIPPKPTLYTVLHHFDAASLDGSFPGGRMVRDASGAIYGTTFLGGQCGYGVVYRLSPPASRGSSWTYTKLHDFGVTTPGSGCDYSDGRQPIGGLTLSGNTILGTTSGGTSSECGTLFSISLGASPSYTKLRGFGLTPGDACTPEAPPTVLADGTIIGTTTQGGIGKGTTACPNGCGTIYSLTPNGGGYTSAILHNFNGSRDGSQPRSPLLPLAGGLFGIASRGGHPGDTTQPDYSTYGAAFRIRP